MYFWTFLDEYFLASLVACVALKISLRHLREILEERRRQQEELTVLEMNVQLLLQSAKLFQAECERMLKPRE